MKKFSLFDNAGITTKNSIVKNFILLALFLIFSINITAETADVNQKMTAAINCFVNQDYKTAKAKFTELLHEDLSAYHKAICWSHIASIYMVEKKEKMALLSADMAIKSAPHEFIGYSIKGDIYLKLEDYDNSIKMYGKCIEIDEKASGFNKYKGFAEYYAYKAQSENTTSKAIDYLNASLSSFLNEIQLNNSDYVSSYMAANIIYDIKKTNNAFKKENISLEPVIGGCLRAIAVNSNFLDPYQLLVFVYSEPGEYQDYNKVYEHCDKLIKLFEEGKKGHVKTESLNVNETNIAKFYTIRGLFLTVKKDYINAERDFNKAVELTPSDQYLRKSRLDFYNYMVKISSKKDSDKYKQLADKEQKLLKGKTSQTEPEDFENSLSLKQINDYFKDDK